MHNFGINSRSVQLKISTCAHKTEYLTYVHNEMGSFLCIILLTWKLHSFLIVVYGACALWRIVPAEAIKNLFKLSYFIKNVMQIGTAWCNLSSLVDFLPGVSFLPFCVRHYGKAIFQIILCIIWAKRDLLMLTICTSWEAELSKASNALIASNVMQFLWIDTTFAHIIHDSWLINEPSVLQRNRYLK